MNVVNKDSQLDEISAYAKNWMTEDPESHGPGEMLATVEEAKKVIASLKDLSDSELERAGNEACMNSQRAGTYGEVDAWKIVEAEVASEQKRRK